MKRDPVQWLMLVIVISSLALSVPPASAKDIYARARGVDWTGGNFIDHVYVCSQGGKADERCYVLTGGKTGGSILSGTTGSASSEAVDGLKCVADNKSTCSTVWGFTGTCQQEANRMLWGVKTTVRKARGYGFSTQNFGVYGLFPNACMSKCWGVVIPGYM